MPTAEPTLGARLRIGDRLLEEYRRHVRRVERLLAPDHPALAEARAGLARAERVANLIWGLALLDQRLGEHEEDD